MVSLKSLKSRTTSVKSIKKITNVMKLVSVSKLRKTRGTFESGEFYTRLINEILESVIKQVDDREQQLLNQTMSLLTGREINKYLLIGIGSDQGLCSSFNYNVAKEIRETVDKLLKNGKGVSILCIGDKVFKELSDVHNIKIELLKHPLNSSAANEEFVQTLVKQFTNNEFDECEVYYTTFISPIVQKVISKTLIPLNRSLAVGHLESDALQSTTFECDPDHVAILKSLTIQVIEDCIRSMILEAKASEYAARMTAMDNATNNASDIINLLTSIYHKKRQANITTELLEIISGAEAIK